MLNPQMTDQQQYTARAKYDKTLEVTVNAATDYEAVMLVLDKIGYTLNQSGLDHGDANFYLVDADDVSIVECSLHTSDFIAALAAAMKELDWTIGEPQELIGGSLGSGFGLEEQ